VAVVAKVVEASKESRKPKNPGLKKLSHAAHRIDGSVRKNRMRRSVAVDALAKTPKPPYYAVIFTSERTEGDNGYGEMADALVALAANQPGFLGVESARGEDGLGITVSYWESLEAIKAWKDHADHQVAQSKGRSDWYRRYVTRICKVERDYSFAK
jgi:heme-degrading monooxygenase HmoA